MSTGRSIWFRERRIYDIALALSIFDPVWGSLTPHEQVRVIHLLVQQIDYDGSKGKVAIAFRPAGERMWPG